MGGLLELPWDHFWTLLGPVGRPRTLEDGLKRHPLGNPNGRNQPPSDWLHPLGSTGEAFWNCPGTIVGLYLGVFGCLWVSLGGHLGVTLVSLWDHFDVTLGSLWYHFGITLWSLRGHFGITFFMKLGMYGSIDLTHGRRSIPVNTNLSSWLASSWFPSFIFFYLSLFASAGITK